MKTVSPQLPEHDEQLRNSLACSLKDKAEDRLVDMWHEKTDNVSSKESSSGSFTTCLKSIWDLSPVKQDSQEVTHKSTTENVSSPTKTNKKRSRATTTASRELFKDSDDFVQPEHATFMDIVSKKKDGMKSRFQGIYAACRPECTGMCWCF